MGFGWVVVLPGQWDGPVERDDECEIDAAFSGQL
jgi:hypothetical protein